MPVELPFSDELPEAVKPEAAKLEAVPPVELPFATAAPAPAPAPEEDSLLETIGARLQQVPSQFQRAAGGFLQAVGEASESLFRIPGTDIDVESPEPIRDLAAQLISSGKNMQADAVARIQQLEPNASGWTAFAGDVVGGAARMVPAIIAGVRSPALGLAILFPDAFGSQYATLREQGVDPDQALIDAGVLASAEVATERIPLGFITGNPAGQALVKRFLGAVGAEGLQEYGMAGIEKLVHDGVLRGDMSLEDAFQTLTDPEVQKEMLYQAGVGAALGGLLTGGVAFTEKALMQDVQAGEDAVLADPTLRARVENFSRFQEDVLRSHAGLLSQPDITGPVEFWLQEEQFDLPEPQRRQLAREAIKKAVVPENLAIEHLMTPVTADRYGVFVPAFSELKDKLTTYTEDKVQVAGFRLDPRIRPPPLQPEEDPKQMGERLTLLHRERYPENTPERIGKQVNTWIKKYAPHLKVIVTDTTPEVLAINFAKKNERSPQKLGRAQGQVMSLMETATGQIWQLEDNTYVINLSSKNLVDTFNGVNYNELYGTLAHEFGHAIALDTLNRMPEHVQRAVRDAYRRFHKDFMTKPLWQVLDTKFSKRAAEGWKAYFNGALGPTELTKTMPELLLEHGGRMLPTVAYLGDFREWMADQFERYASNPKQGLGDADRFFIRTTSLLQKFFAGAGAFRYRASPDFASYLEQVKHTRFERNWSALSKGAGIGTQLSRLSTRVGGLDPPHTQMKEIAGQADRFNSVMSQIYTVRQIAQLNGHVMGMQSFVNGLEAMANTKNHILHKTDNRLVEMSNLGKQRLDNVGRFLLEETVDGRPFDVTDQKIIDRYKLDPQMIQVIQNVKNDFAEILNQVEAVLAADIIDRFQNDPQRLQIESQRLSQHMNRMRAQPYFPLARFGRYTVVTRVKGDVEIEGRAYKNGEVVDMRTFKNQREQRTGKREAEQDYQGQPVIIGMDYLEESSFSFSGMPPQMYEALADQLELTPKQREELQQYRIDHAPGRSFLKHLKKRNKTLGFSEDAQRGYADYMLRSANHLARITHYKALNASMNDVGTSATTIQRQGGNATKRRKMHEYMAGTYHYIMNPTNELQSLRSFFFLWWLGANVKSALVQLTQPVLTTYPKLATEFDDVKATAALAKAVKDTHAVWRNPNKLDPEVRQALLRAEDAGVVDQSFATIVAGVAEGHVLQRVLPGSKGARALKNISHIGAWMFSKTELMNRRITFLAAYDLVKQRGMNPDAAYDYAKNTVQDTQFEYAKWNRPKLFRGKKGVFFIFKSYQQGMLYLLLHDKARWRMLGTMTAIGGLMGLPFAEDLMDILDWALSDDNEKFDSRREVRELLNEWLSKPDMILHGVSRESFGLAALADWIGVPFPRVDLSGTVGMGRVIPGVEAMFTPAERPTARLSRAVSDAAGAGIAVPLQIASVALAWDTQPDKARLLERAMPAAFRQAARSFRWFTEGGEKVRGATKVPFSWQDTEQRMEIIAGALGFQPTRLAERRERDRMFRRHAVYYGLRRSKLMEDYAYVYMLRDREGVADARRAIRIYNREVPDKRLRIAGEDLRRSLKARIRNAQKIERGIPIEGKRYRGLYEEIESLYYDDSRDKEVADSLRIAPDLPFSD